MLPSRPAPAALPRCSCAVFDSTVVLTRIVCLGSRVRSLPLRLAIAIVCSVPNRKTSPMRTLVCSFICLRSQLSVPCLCSKEEGQGEIEKQGQQGQGQQGQGRQGLNSVRFIARCTVLNVFCSPASTIGTFSARRCACQQRDSLLPALCSLLPCFAHAFLFCSTAFDFVLLAQPLRHLLFCVIHRFMSQTIAVFHPCIVAAKLSRSISPRKYRASRTMHFALTSTMSASHRRTERSRSLNYHHRYCVVRSLFAR